MKAVVLENHAIPEGIVVRELASAPLRPGTARVKILAAAVTHVDTFVASGAYRTELAPERTIGRDAVGQVLELCPGVESFRVGDIVFTNSMGYDGRPGVLAEEAVIPVERLFAVPRGADPVATAALIHSGTTAAVGLFEKARIQEGSRVLIVGSAGAVGSAAEWLSALAGAEVTTVARGSGATFTYGEGEWIATLAARKPGGFNAVWDVAGRYDLGDLVPPTATNGTLVVSAGLHKQLEVEAGQLYTRNLTVAGFAMSALGTEELSKGAAWVQRLAADASFAPTVDSVVDLAGTPEAYSRVLRGEARGRVVVVP